MFTNWTRFRRPGAPPMARTRFALGRLEVMKQMNSLVRIPEMEENTRNYKTATGREGDDPAVNGTRLTIFHGYPAWWTNILPWKITIFNGKIHYKWPFSIAMLVHQRVHQLFLWVMAPIANCKKLLEMITWKKTELNGDEMVIEGWFNGD